MSQLQFSKTILEEMPTPKIINLTEGWGKAVEYLREIIK